ncbi:methyltransfer with n-terminal ankyrin repeats [Nannochloropsis oceanica]
MTSPDAASTVPNDEEVGNALLEAARYGDLEDLQQLTNTYGKQRLAYRGANGNNTALHYACANGHTDCVAWLIEQGVEGAPCNESGNTPLHWAVQNQHDEVVRILLAKLDNVDVLIRNGFGKSVLTEGFAGKNQEILKMLLEHSSAAEDALMGVTGQGLKEEGLQEMNEGEEGEETEVAVTLAIGENDEATAAVVVHRLVLDKLEEPERVLQIREMEIKHADDPFGQAAAEDTTGLGVWPASLILARWLVIQHKELLDDATVVELGCGCAVPGLAAALHGRPKVVHLTDLNPETLANAQENVQLNKESFLVPDAAARVHVTAMDWGNKASYPAGAIGSVDVVLGSDLVYQKSLGPLLSQVLLRLLRPGGKFLYVAPATGRDGLPEFLDMLSHGAGLTLVSEKEAGPELLANPLEGSRGTAEIEEDDGGIEMEDHPQQEAAERADESFFLHFHEMATKGVMYKLYEFEKQ